MQNAPSVTFPLGHFAFYRFFLVALGALSGALLAVGWWSSWATSPWNTSHGLWAVGFVVWAIWSGMIWRHRRQTIEGALHWDAQAVPAEFGEHAGAWLWRWNDPLRAPVPVRIVPVLDGQTHVLIRLHGVPEVGRWAWFERDTDPQRWDDFRRALTAHAKRA